MKTLIIYTTKYGCTEKAANILKSKMAGEINTVNLAKEPAPDLQGYDNVILGGSIYIGKIQKKIAAYAASTLPLLLIKKVGLFICAGQPEEEIRLKELEDAFPPELFKHATAKEVFGYEYNVDKLGFLDKLILRKVAGVQNSISDLSEEKITTFARLMSGN